MKRISIYLWISLVNVSLSVSILFYLFNLYSGIINPFQTPVFYFGIICGLITLFPTLIYILLKKTQSNRFAIIIYFAIVLVIFILSVLFYLFAVFGILVLICSPLNIIIINYYDKNKFSLLIINIIGIFIIIMLSISIFKILLFDDKIKTLTYNYLNNKLFINNICRNFS